MRTIVKLIPIASAVAWAFIGSAACGGDFQDPWKEDPASLAYYRDTYEANRAAFRKAATEIARTTPGAKTGLLKMPSRKDRDLTIDWAYLPSRGSASLLILTCGVHGGEGYASSAVQRMLMREFLSKPRPGYPNVLLIHGVNPFGMKFFRRVSENNVDLNRNWDTTPALFATKNKGYTELKDFMNPREKASIGFFRDMFFPVQSVYYIATKGMSTLRQAILGGQYEHPQSIYFGGKAFEPQKALLEPLFKKYIAGKRVVLTIDLHTGYGERGTLHLFPNPIKNPVERKLAEKIFAGYKIDWGDSGDFYMTHGDFANYIGKLTAKSTLYVPMVFEYGTLDSQTTMGSIRSIQNMILENQGYHHGYKDADDKKEIERRFREHYYPSSPAWRSKIMKDSREIFPLVLKRLATK